MKILLVDDEPQFLKMLKFKFLLDNYEVVTAINGKIGIEKAFSESPNIIFLDIKIPEIDGFEVIRRLRRSPITRYIPILILSNFEDQEMIEKGLSLGANEYLVKTRFTPEEVSAKVKNWISA
ncbi:response regulator [Patescibacteria group bacterium]|nr:response regulator [Patescibacteria group bacterium]